MPDLTSFVGTLVNEIYETIPDYFVVVIDDYHLVDGSQAVNLALDTLVQHLPENCHMIISSRSVPTLTPRGLALLTARQQVAGLGVKDLRFTAAEIRALLQQNYGQTLSDEAAHELAEKSEGWITGILLTTHTMWKGLFEGMIRIRGSDSRVYDYLANEVFSLQAPAVQRFLLSTSILDEMSPLLCDELLGISDSREILKLLEDRNLFLIRLEREEERWYRYHHLFREFLLTKLREEDPRRFADLHLRAARVLQRSGAVEQAIQHYLTVADYQSAIQATLEIAAEMYDAGKLETLARWIDALPPEMVQAWPRLLFYRAKVHLEVGQLDQATSLFDRAYAQFAQQEDRYWEARTLVEQSAVLRFRGETRKAIEACERAISLVKNDPGQAEVMRVLAEAYRQKGTCLATLGELLAGEAELRQALHIYESAGSAGTVAYVHLDLGAILQLAGNLGGAELHFRQALEIWERLGNVGMAALAINNIAIGHHYRGEYTEALRLYGVGLNEAQRARLERPMAFILAGIGDVHRDQGQYAEALTAYEEGLQAAWQSRDNSIISYLLDAMGNAYRLLGNYTSALNFVRQAYDRAQEREATFEMALHRTSLGVISYEQGNIRQAEEYLSQAQRVFIRSHAYRELAKASLYLAQAFYVAGRFQEALDCMHTVLASLLKLGYYQFLLPVARETKRVIEYSLSKGMRGTLIQNLLHTLNTAGPAESAAPAEQESAAVQPLLRVYGFGESRVLKGDEPIANAAWGMAKSKELLFYLLCHKQRRKDQIGMDLWPELSSAKLRSSFHVALYRLRRALDQQDCVKYEDDQYFFNRRINYWFDVEEFERAIQEASSAWSTDRAKAAQAYVEAIVMYRGDFLEELCDHDWCFFKREELLQQYVAALDRLGEYYTAMGNYHEALRYYEKVVEKDNYQESAYRGIIYCQALLGERSTALKTYRRLVELFERELDAQPTQETSALYESVLQGKIAPS